MNKTSDYISFDTAFRKGNELLKSEKYPIIGFYILSSIHFGLRVSDVLKLTHSDLINKKENDILFVKEKKTGKAREITINKNIEYSYNILVNWLKKNNRYDEHGYIFVTNKNKVYSTRTLNRIIKRIFNNSRLNYSTHSLRKAFGRKVYENHQQSDHSLILLSELFRHSSVAITRRYLGLRKEEIGNVYLTL